ncbi:hypothetical protein BKA70DRAFT_1227292 [Coprinopsis sp. MPI-PUGE-AT-0042]|nr:hypothetical protein BKA70DRAFT_1227292 [Coprinopsis sp. MPI-PUGE-AT-0042]
MALGNDEKTPGTENLGGHVTLLPSLPASVVEAWMGSTRWFGLRLGSNCSPDRGSSQHQPATVSATNISKVSNIPGTSASLKIPNRSKDRINLHMREVSIRKPGIKKRRTGLECPNYYLFDNTHGRRRLQFITIGLITR